MECKYAYKKNGVNYVLCKCQGEPESVKMQDLAHCMCGHQRFCGKIQDCTLLPTWQQCQVMKQALANERAALDALAMKIGEEQAVVSKRRKVKRK